MAIAEGNAEHRIRAINKHLQTNCRVIIEPTNEGLSDILYSLRIIKSPFESQMGREMNTSLFVLSYKAIFFSAQDPNVPLSDRVIP